MAAHSFISPSAAHRWITCPGSVVMERGIVDKGSVFAAEGTALHMVAAWCLEQQRTARERIGHTICVDDHQFNVDDEMAETVQAYVDALHTAYGWADDASVKAFEVRLPFGRALGLDDTHQGTADALIVRGTEIQVHDLKGGRGHQVLAEDNPQLMLYALGALQLYGEFFDVQTVRLVIHQPRLDHLDEAIYSVDYLLNTFKPIAAKAAARAVALHGNQVPLIHADLSPTNGACLWCKAKAKCPALQGTVSESLGHDVAASEFTTSAELLTAFSCDPLDRMGVIYGRLPLVRAWADAVEAEVRANLERGADVPGWKLVAGRKGQRQWSDPDQVEAICADSMRLTQEQMYASKLHSPAQLQKVLADQPKRWARLEPFITQGETKPVVAPAHDPRQALAMPAFTEVDA